MHRLVAEARFEDAERRWPIGRCRHLGDIELTSLVLAQGNGCLLTNSLTGALSLEVNRSTAEDMSNEQEVPGGTSVPID